MLQQSRPQYYLKVDPLQQQPQQQPQQLVLEQVLLLATLRLLLLRQVQVVVVEALVSLVQHLLLPAVLYVAHQAHQLFLIPDHLSNS